MVLMRRRTLRESAPQQNVSVKAQLQVTVEGSKSRLLVPVIVKTVGYRVARVRLPWGVEYRPDIEKGEMLTGEGTPFFLEALFRQQRDAQDKADKARAKKKG